MFSVFIFHKSLINFQSLFVLLQAQIKSVAIAGPRGTGKKLLVHAICTETGATLFDLSAPTIVGKYPGKAGLAMLFHLVFKVSEVFPEN